MVGALHSSPTQDSSIENGALQCHYIVFYGHFLAEIYLHILKDLMRDAIFLVAKGLDLPKSSYKMDGILRLDMQHLKDRMHRDLV